MDQTKSCSRQNRSRDQFARGWWRRECYCKTNSLVAVYGTSAKFSEIKAKRGECRRREFRLKIIRDVGSDPSYVRLPAKADIPRGEQYVRLVPIADIPLSYSITSAAATSTDGGIVRPSALAVFKFTVSSTFVDCCTGKSAGFSPLRMRPV